MTDIPDDHPRADSLRTRHRLEEAVEAGITHLQGLIAHGRGEAFDYLLGERTLESADRAERAAAAELLRADRPVISVNGNVAALVPSETVELAAVTDAAIEVNLFNRSDQRIERIAAHLREHGAESVYGLTADATIPGLDHGRGQVDSDGIAAADVVLVPLEDGDRAEALRAMGKTLIVVDLNPLSRSARAAHVPVVDNVTRAFPRMIEHAQTLDGEGRRGLEAPIREFDPDTARDAAEAAIRTGTWDT